MNRRLLFARMALAALAACTGAARAEKLVEVRDAWVRPAYQLPSGTGLYMTIVVRQPLRLVGARSPVAQAAVLHATELRDGVMLMHEMPQGLVLPAGHPMVLEPGGYQIILERLKRPVVTGGVVAVRLAFADGNGRRLYHDVRAPVRLVAPGQPEPAGHGHGHGTAGGAGQRAHEGHHGPR